MSKARNLADLLSSTGAVKADRLANVPPADLVNDATPQLGGNLDMNTRSIAGVDATEMGILDGATLTTAELNYVGGVTSSIQSQIDGKTTEAYVDTSISNLVASSPAALDTLNELATALGNDANFSTTVTNSLATKATSASPTLTGTPTTPTAATTTSTTQIASTAFVQQEIAAIPAGMAAPLFSLNFSAF